MKCAKYRETGIIVINMIPKAMYTKTVLFSISFNSKTNKVSARKFGKNF